jgi:Flp pilus assembly pilin Flp
VDVMVLTLSVRMQSVTEALVKGLSGQDLIEYALVVALIALAATAAMGVVASSISGCCRWFHGVAGGSPSKAAV